MIAPGKDRSVAGRVLAVGCLLAALLITGSFLLSARPAFADTITVTNTADPGDGVCNASGCTLREAIKKANDTSSKDAIHFDIAGGAEVKTIKPKSQLPQVTWPVTIDGYTQSGASKNTLNQGTNAVLTIELNGEDSGPTELGLKIRASHSTITGLVINRFGSNDTDDGDTGPNNLQNKPNLASARNKGGKTTVKGSLDSVPNRTFRIRFFSNPSGNEGKKFIGARNVTTDANGETGSLTFEPENKVGANRTITATATRLLAGDTSEFSNAEVVVAS